MGNRLLPRLLLVLLIFLISHLVYSQSTAEHLALGEKAFRENFSKSNATTQEDINNIKDELKDIKELMFTLIQKLEHNKVN